VSPPPRLQREGVLQGKISIHVSEIQLRQRRLGKIDARYAYGEGMLGGSSALAVLQTTSKGEG
jgi:hypothetical protein